MGFFIRRGLLPLLFAGPLFLGLPMGSGMAAAAGALVGVAAVLPLAIVLGVLPLRTALGWPLWLLRVLLGR